MNKPRFKQVLMVVLAAMMVGGCKPGIPEYVIPQDKMEDILYDYHLAEGAAAQDFNAADFKRSLYGRAVFKKYGITEAEFDTSMVYYMANTRYLHEIYKSLTERFKKQVEGMGSSAGLVTIENASDTASIWSGAKSVLLQPMAPYNRLSFDMTTDSTFHVGDKIIMNFDTRFLWQEGIKDGVLLLAATFGNDSVASRIVHISTSSHYNISVEDDKNKGIKRINGCFYLSAGNDGNKVNSTLKLLFINNIALIRMHQPKPKDDAARKDSLQRAANRTIVPDSSVRRQEPNGNQPTGSSAGDSARGSQPEALSAGGVRQMKINP